MPFYVCQSPWPRHRCTPARALPVDGTLAVILPTPFGDFYSNSASTGVGGVLAQAFEEEQVGAEASARIFRVVDAELAIRAREILLGHRNGSACGGKYPDGYNSCEQDA